jgi:hypothetical protein
MQVVRDIIDLLMVAAIMLLTPFKGLPVQVSEIQKCPACEKVVFDESDETLDFPLGERMTRLAQFRLESDSVHEGFIIRLPHGISFKVSSNDNTFHVVRQDVLWDSHEGECMEHPDEQVLLFGVRKEFHIAFAAMMTDHCEAGYTESSAVLIVDCDEAPVHLIGFAWSGMIAESAISLWINYLPFSRNQIFMLRYVLLDLGLPTGISQILKSFKAYNRVSDALPEQIIKCSCETAENRDLSVLAGPSMRHRLEVIAFESAEPGSCDPGTSLKLGQVDLISRQRFSLIGFHFTDGLCYDCIQVITIIAVHIPPSRVIGSYPV